MDEIDPKEYLDDATPLVTSVRGAINILKQAGFTQVSLVPSMAVKGSWHYDSGMPVNWWHLQVNHVGTMDETRAYLTQTLQGAGFSPTAVNVDRDYRPKDKTERYATAQIPWPQISRDVAENWVEGLLERESAALPSHKAEIKILPAQGLDHHHDIILVSDRSPIYLGTIAPKHSVWRVSRTAPNVGRKMRTALHWHMPTKEECAIRMVEVMRPYWKPIIAHHGLLGMFEDEDIGIEGVDPKEFVNREFGQLRTLADLRKYPDEQIFACTDPILIRDWKLPNPFYCWNVYWKGQGVVSIAFYTGDITARSIEHNDFAQIKYLKPVSHAGAASMFENDEIDPKEYASQVYAEPMEGGGNAILVRDHRAYAGKVLGQAWPDANGWRTVPLIPHRKHLHQKSFWRDSQEDAIAFLKKVHGITEDTKAEIDTEAGEAEKPASEEQAEAGNYKKGHVNVQGLEIAIENAKDSTREGVGKDGKPWKVTLPAHYGYIKGTLGKDKDHLDVYIGDNPSGMLVFVVNQNHEEGGFDEHKIMLGFANKAEAIAAYDAAFSGDLGPKLRDSVVSTTMDGLKAWIDSDKTKKPFEPVAESLVGDLLEDDVDPKEMAMSTEPQPTRYGQLKVGTVLYTETGSYDRVEGKVAGYGTSYQDATGRLVYDSGPATLVRLTEFSPAYAYGYFPQRATYNGKAALLGCEIVDVADNSDEALWKLVDEDMIRNGRSAEEIQASRDQHRARQAANPEQADARARMARLMGENLDDDGLMSFDDIKAFIEPLATAHDQERALAQLQGREFHIGFSISTSDENSIQDNAAERGIQPNWDAINTAIQVIERNGISALESTGMQVRSEGHGNDSALVGSAWVQGGSAGFNVIKQFIDNSEEPFSTGRGNLSSVVPGLELSIYAGVPDDVAPLIDVDISFFALEKVTTAIEEPDQNGD